MKPIQSQKQKHQTGVFIVKFEKIFQLFIVFLLLPLKK